MDENDISRIIVDCAYHIHRELGPGLLESVYEKVLMQERKVYYLERPMKEKRLPEILSQEEVINIFEAVDNLKHKTFHGINCDPDIFFANFN